MRRRRDVALGGQRSLSRRCWLALSTRMETGGEGRAGTGEGDNVKEPPQEFQRTFPAGRVPGLADEGFGPDVEESIHGYYYGMFLLWVNDVLEDAPHTNNCNVIGRHHHNPLQFREATLVFINGLTRQAS